MTKRRGWLLRFFTVTIILAGIYFSPGPLRGVYRIEPVCGDAAYTAVRDGSLVLITMCDRSISKGHRIDLTRRPAIVTYRDNASVELRPRLLFLDMHWRNPDGSTEEDRYWRRWWPIRNLDEFDRGVLPPATPQ